MTFDIAILSFGLLVMIVLFFTEKLPLEISALIALIFFTVLGFLSPEEAFSGFSSPAVLTMIATFFLGASLRHTGLAEILAEKVHSIAGSKETLNIICVMLMAAFLSAFMNNVAATAILLPAVASIAHNSEVHPSRLFMPLAFGAVLGGMLTLIGTAPNIIASDILRERGYESFGFFEFSPFGLFIGFLCVVFVSFVGRRFIRKRDSRTIGLGPGGRKSDLSDLYKLHERMFALRVPRKSSLNGKSLKNTHFGEALGVQVVSIIRDGKRILAPTAEDVLKGGDTLVVRGKQEDLHDLLRFQGLNVERERPANAPEIKAGHRQDSHFQEYSLVINDDTLLGRSARELRFREEFGVAIIGIEREQKFVYKNLGREKIKRGDILHVVGPAKAVESLQSNPQLKFIENESETGDKLHLSRYFSWVTVHEESSLDRITVRQSRFGELTGLNIAGILREGSMLLGPSREDEILAGDKLLLVGENEEVERLSQLAELKLISEDADPKLESSQIGVAEVVLAPRSKLINKSLKDVDFREKYGFSVLAIWREGAPIRSKIARMTLHFGDALLLQGPRNRFRFLAEDSDFVMLSGAVKTRVRREKAPIAVASLIVMILLVVLNLQPIHVAAFIAAILVVVLGATTMEEVYREIEWRIVFLVAALIPIGLAVENTGASALITTHMMQIGGDGGYITVLIILALAASVLSQTLDGTVAVVLLAPIAIGLAESLNMEPYAMVMIVAISASIAFLTPFSHKANLLVMGAGGYKPLDYTRIGAVLTVIAFLGLFALLPLLY